MDKGVVRTATSINIDKGLWKEFKGKCLHSERTATEQMETLIRNWLKLHSVRVVKTSTRG